MTFKSVSDINDRFEISVPDDAEIIDSAYTEIESIHESFYCAVLVKIPSDSAEDYVKNLEENCNAQTDRSELEEEWLESCCVQFGESKSISSDPNKHNYDVFAELAEKNGLSKDNLIGIYTKFYTALENDPDSGKAIARTYDKAYVFNIENETYILIEG